MTKKFWSAVIGFGMLMFSVGCSERTTPFAPSTSTMNDFGAASGPTTSETYSSPVVTLEPDLTANPSTVTVKEWDSVLMVNNSGQYVRIRSYNCSQFLIIGLQPGDSQYTWPFRPAGKTCNYFTWDANWKEIFVGQVVVQ